eukprot:TRINITY_DN1310_c1_g1_i1.p1 TRINITY_DN1310_c1_g1~~TRINITY_DN1310_c1_g1_i1.p1  ORF type:complete len:1874 (+),score=333.76 TRINITY_DN1310_c1_g1_i1:198-5624(+)
MTQLIDEMCDLLMGLVEYDELVVNSAGVVHEKGNGVLMGLIQTGETTDLIESCVPREAQVIDVRQLVWIRRAICTRLNAMLVENTQLFLTEPLALFTLLEKCWGLQSSYPASQPASTIVTYLALLFKKVKAEIHWNDKDYSCEESDRLLLDMVIFHNTLHHVISPENFSFETFDGELSNSLTKQLPVLKTVWAAPSTDFTSILPYIPELVVPLSTVLNCSGVENTFDLVNPLLAISLLADPNRDTTPPAVEWPSHDIEVTRGFLKGLQESENPHLKFISGLRRPFLHGLIVSLALSGDKASKERQGLIVRFCTEAAQRSSSVKRELIESLRICSMHNPYTVVIFTEEYIALGHNLSLLLSLCFSNELPDGSSDAVEKLASMVLSVIGELLSRPTEHTVPPGCIIRDFLCSKVWGTASKECKTASLLRLGEICDENLGSLALVGACAANSTLFDEVDDDKVSGVPVELLVASRLSGDVDRFYESISELDNDFETFLDICSALARVDSEAEYSTDKVSKWEECLKTVLVTSPRTEVAMAIYTHTKANKNITKHLINTCSKFVFTSPDIVDLIDLALSCYFLCGTYDNAAMKALIRLVDHVGSWIETDRIYTYLSAGQLLFGGVLLLNRLDPSDADSIQFSLSCIQLIANLMPSYGLVLWQYFLDEGWSAAVDGGEVRVLEKEVSSLWLQCAQTATSPHLSAMFHACAVFDTNLILHTRSVSMSHVVETLRREIFTGLGLPLLYSPLRDETPSPLSVPLGITTDELRSLPFFNDSPAIPNAKDLSAIAQGYRNWTQICEMVKEHLNDGTPDEGYGRGVLPLLRERIQAVYDKGCRGLMMEGTAVRLMEDAFTMEGGYSEAGVGEKIARMVNERAEYEGTTETEELADLIEGVVTVATDLDVERKLAFCKNLLEFLAEHEIVKQATWSWLSWVQLLGVCYDTYRSALKCSTNIDIQHLLTNVVKLATIAPPSELPRNHLASIFEEASLSPVYQSSATPFHASFVNKCKTNRSLVSGARRILQTSIERSFVSLVKKIKMSPPTKAKVIHLMLTAVTDNHGELLHIIESIIGGPACFDGEQPPYLEADLFKCLECTVPHQGLRRVSRTFAAGLVQSYEGMLRVVRLMVRGLPETKYLMSIVGVRATEAVGELLAVLIEELSNFNFSSSNRAHHAWLEIASDVENALMSSPQEERVWDLAMTFFMSLITRLSEAGDRGRASSPLVEAAQSITVLSLSAEGAVVNRCVDAALLLPQDLREAFIEALPWFHGTFHRDLAVLSDTCDITKLDDRSKVDVMNCLSRLDWGFLADETQETKEDFANLLLPLAIDVLLFGGRVRELVHALPVMEENDMSRSWAWICEHTKGTWHSLWKYCTQDTIQKLSLSQSLREGHGGSGVAEAVVESAGLVTRILLNNPRAAVEGGAAHFASDLRLLLFCVIQSPENGQAWMLPLDHHVSLVQHCLLPLSEKYGSGGMARQFIATVLSCLSVRSAEVLAKTVVTTRAVLPFAGHDDQLSTCMGVIAEEAATSLPRVLSLITSAVLAFAASAPQELSLSIFSSAAMLLAPTDASPLLAHVLQAASSGLIHRPHANPEHLLSQAFTNLVMPPTDTALADLVDICQQKRYTSLLLVLLQYKLHDAHGASLLDLLSVVEEVLRVGPGPDTTGVDIVALLIVGCSVMGSSEWDAKDKRVLDCTQRYLRLLDGLATKNCGAKLTGLKGRLFNKGQQPTSQLLGWAKADIKVSVACVALGGFVHQILGTLSKKEVATRVSTCKHCNYSKTPSPDELLDAATCNISILRNVLQTQIYPSCPIFVSF